MSDRHIYSSMLQEFNVERIRRINRERDARIAALSTRNEAENYCMEVRSKIASCFNIPERSGVPPVRITGSFDLPESTVEKIIYESRPGLPVTAHFYRPRNIIAPVPGVLFLCGHAQNGKDSPVYQTCCRTLASLGYAVLAVDPVAQGERLQFTGKIDAAGIAGFCTREHNMLGKQMGLCGEFFGSWRAHDALCGLDYLLSRPEVDVSRIGVTGNSGGGTLTTWVQALDPRFTMAAPSCYVTSWKRNIENELPADAEQTPPGIHACGCEMGDFILAYAPRPVLLLGQKKDFFDPRGLLETYEQCRKVYALLGAEENLQCFVGPDPHSYSAANRERMYRFFGEISGQPVVFAEPPAVYNDPAVKNCTPTGQCADMPEYKLFHDLIVEKTSELAAARKELPLAELRRAVAAGIGINTNIAVPYCRNLRPSAVNKESAKHFLFARFGLETEPGILAVLKIPVRADAHCFPPYESMTLYVPHQDSAEELSDFEPDSGVAGVDVRGLGESMALTCDRYENDFFTLYGRDYHYNSCSLMAGSSLLTERVRDLLGAIAFVKSRGVKNICLAGRGIGAVVALLGALFSDDVSGVKLFDAPESWSSMASSRVTLWPHSIMPFGILQITDIPEICKILSGRIPVEITGTMDNYLRKEF